MATLTELEATALTLPRAQGAQVAGACYDLRQQLARGVSFATARDAVALIPRHFQQLENTSQLTTFQTLTGP